MDDSNSVISYKDPTEANHYLDRYFWVLKPFYKQNKLMLNPEKTNVLVVAKPTVKAEAKDIRILTDNDDVTPKKAIKVLGWDMNECLSLDVHMNKQKHSKELSRDNNDGSAPGKEKLLL